MIKYLHARRLAWRRRLRRFPLRMNPRHILYRLKRLPADPHAIAVGFASGAGLSCTPLFGLHFLLALALAWILRGNMIAAAIGTVIGNPLTFPIFVSVSYLIGSTLFMSEAGTSGHGMLTILKESFWITLSGSLFLAVGVFVASYLLLRPAIARLQARSRRR